MEPSEFAQVIHAINGLYQDIEIILRSDIPDDSKLLAVDAKNLEIGTITAKWV